LRRDRLRLLLLVALELGEHVDYQGGVLRVGCAGLAGLRDGVGRRRRRGRVLVVLVGVRGGRRDGREGRLDGLAGLRQHGDDRHVRRDLVLGSPTLAARTLLGVALGRGLLLRLAARLLVRLGVHDEPATVAVLAGGAERLDEALAYALAGHL